MKVAEVRDILKADLLFGEALLERTVSGAGGADLMADVLAAAAKDALLLTGLTTEHVIRTAKIVGVAAVVFVRGKTPGSQIIELGRSFELPILCTEYSLFVACGRLYMNGLRGLDGSW